MLKDLLKRLLPYPVRQQLRTFHTLASTTSVPMTRSIDLVTRTVQPVYSLAATRHSYEH